MRRPLLALAVVLLPVCLAAQSTLTVPGQYPTIQAALDAASPGDTVLVAPGVYTEQIRIFKPISLIGEQGAAVTHLVGGGLTGVVFSLAVPLPGIYIEGLTIRDGIDTGLVFSGGDLVVVKRCVIRNNHGLLGAGTPGGVYTTASDTRFEECVIADNVGSDAPDGLVQPGFPPLCRPGYQGGAGAILTPGFLGGQVRLVNCLVARNVGGAGGDGAVDPSCPVQGAAGPGGNGSFGRPVSPVAPTPGYLLAYHTTIVDNVGGPPGSGSAPAPAGIGGIAHFNGHVSGCILWNNAGGNYNSLTNTLVEHSNVGGSGGGGTGIIDADPRFVDPMNGDYRLQAGSPCIDLADPGTSFFPAVDLEGNPRIVGAGPDMGFDEYAPRFSGSGEDLVLASTLDGRGADLWIKPGFGGQDLVVDLVSPGGGLDGALPAFFAQLFLTGLMPAGVPAYPELHVDPDLIILLFDGINPAFPLPPGGLTFGPVTLPANAPPGLTMRLQAIGVDGGAANGIFATTDADDIVFP